MGGRLLSGINHIIKNQVLELHVQDKQHLEWLQEEVSRILREKVWPGLEKVFDQLAPEDTWVKIDSLVIDIGKIRLNHLEVDLTNQILELFPRELRERIDFADWYKDEEVQIRTSSRVVADQLLQFLRNGTQAWNTSAAAAQSWNDRLPEILEREKVALLPALQAGLRVESFRKRIAFQFSDPVFHQFVTLLLPGLGNFAVELIADLHQVYRLRPWWPGSASMAKTDLRIALLAAWEAYPTQDTPVNREQVFQQLFLKLAETVHINPSIFFQQLSLSLQEPAVQGRPFAAQLPHHVAQLGNRRPEWQPETPTSVESPDSTDLSPEDTKEEIESPAEKEAEAAELPAKKAPEYSLTEMEDSLPLDSQETDSLEGETPEIPYDETVTPQDTASDLPESPVQDYAEDPFKIHLVPEAGRDLTEPADPEQLTADPSETPAKVPEEIPETELPQSPQLKEPGALPDAPKERGAEMEYDEEVAPERPPAISPSEKEGGEDKRPVYEDDPFTIHAATPEEQADELVYEADPFSFSGLPEKSEELAEVLPTPPTGKVEEPPEVAGEQKKTVASDAPEDLPAEEQLEGESLTPSTGEQTLEKLPDTQETAPSPKETQKKSSSPKEELSDSEEDALLKAAMEKEKRKREQKYPRLQPPPAAEEDAVTGKKQPAPFTLPDYREVEEIFVQNAGLVLLCIYIGRFFNYLELVKNREFVDEAAQMKAIHLLQYLATGVDGPYPEEELALNKLLVGLPLDTPVPAELPLSADEKQAADELLQAVIDNWGRIGKTSPNGLRGTFLLRPGRLSKVKKDWNLKVEKKSLDVLIKSLPWGYETIRLSWNPYKIFVEWM